MGRHRAEPEGFPAEMWQNPDVRDAGSAFWDGVVDYAEDGELSESARDRMVRSGRTLLQGSAGVSIVAGLLAVLPVDVPPEAAAAVTAALTAVVTFFHTRK